MSATSLIAAVHKRRALWDPTDVHHHNRVIVAGLWKQIGFELGINSMLAKSKWRGLRDYYRQQLKRAMEQPESSAGSSWSHFDDMSFLGPSMSAARPVKVEEEEEAELDEEKWSSQSEDLSPEDDDLLFFRSLLPDLRGLPRSKKAWIRLQIQQIVFQEVYSGCKSPHPSCHSPLQIPCSVEIAADTD